MQPKTENCVEAVYYEECRCGHQLSEVTEAAKQGNKVEPGDLVLKISPVYNNFVPFSLNHWMA